MDKKHVIVLLLLIISVGCATAPTKPGTDGIVFNQPIEVVQKTGIDALVVNGFEIKKTTADYIEGYRPRRWGFFSGSGGETVGIWMTSEGTSATKIRVETTRTFRGGSGQKDWDDDIYAEMKKNLTTKN